MGYWSQGFPVLPNFETLDSRLDIGKQIFGAKKVSGIILSFCVPLVFKATVVTKEVFGFVNNVNFL